MCKKSPKEFKHLLELINSFCKFAGYDINIQKSIAFLFSGNKYTKMILGKKNLLTVA